MVTNDNIRLMSYDYQWQCTRMIKFCQTWFYLHDIYVDIIPITLRQPCRINPCISGLFVFRTSPSSDLSTQTCYSLMNEVSIYSIWHCNAVVINHLCSFKKKHNNCIMSRLVHEMKQFHILRAAQKVLSGCGSQSLAIVCVSVCETQPPPTCWCFSPSPHSTPLTEPLSSLVAEQRRPSASPSPPSISVINLSDREKRNCWIQICQQLI